MAHTIREKIILVLIDTLIHIDLFVFHAQYIYYTKFNITVFI